MANHASAKKRHRQSLRQRSRNAHWRATVRNAVRRVRSAVAAGESELEVRFGEAERLLRRASSKGILHKRTVSRTISRLSKLVHPAD